MQAFGRQFGPEGGAHPLRRGVRVKTCGAVAEVEGEGRPGQPALRANQDLAGVAAGGGGRRERLFEIRGQVGRDADDQARLGLDFPGQACESAFKRRPREHREDFPRDRPGAGEGQFRRPFAMGVGDLRQPAQPLVGGAGDVGEGSRLDRGHISGRLLLALRKGAGADHLHLVGREVALRPGRGAGDVASAVEDRVEPEFLEERLGHQ